MVWGYESWKSWSTDLWIKSLYLNSNMYLFSHSLLPQWSQISQPWPWYPPSLGAWGLPTGTLEPLLVPSVAPQHFQAPPRRGGTHSFTHLWGLCAAHGEKRPPGAAETEAVTDFEEAGAHQRASPSSVWPLCGCFEGFWEPRIFLCSYFSMRCEETGRETCFRETLNPKEWGWGGRGGLFSKVGSMLETITWEWKMEQKVNDAF